jgi:hypothetical protein
MGHAIGAVHQTFHVMCIHAEHLYSKVYYILWFWIRLGENMSMQKAVAGTIITVAIIVMMTSALALLQPSTTITNTGAIEALNVGVYQDSACTQSLTALNWGILRPGTSANRTIYVRNTGNAALTLNMTATAWNPPTASSYMTLTWDRQGSLLAPGNKVTALLILSVSADVNGFTDFNCTTIISGQWWTIAQVVVAGT